MFQFKLRHINRLQANLVPKLDYGLLRGRTFRQQLEPALIDDGDDDPLDFDFESSGVCRTFSFSVRDRAAKRPRRERIPEPTERHHGVYASFLYGSDPAVILIGR